MPMYEFFCPDCDTIFTFFSRKINTETIPACPKCSRELTRTISRFAFTGQAKSGEGEDGADSLPIDETKMEHAMEALASEAEGIDESNPRQAAELMRKFSNLTGLKLGDKVEDALSRMEAGEDPESLEQEMGDIDEKDLFKLDEAAGTAAASKPKMRKSPMRDENFYEM